MSDTREQTGTGSEDAEGRIGVTKPGGLAESVDISQREDVQSCARARSACGSLFLTVTGSAPISAMLFNTRSRRLRQRRRHAGRLMFAAVVLVIFSVGYVAMARKKTTAGGFYSISATVSPGDRHRHGFGAVLATRLRGLAVRRVRLLLNIKLAHTAPTSAGRGWLRHGALISILAWFDVRISTVVLAVGLNQRGRILIIFDIVMFAHGGLPLAALNPVNAFKGFRPRTAAGRRGGHRHLLSRSGRGWLRDGTQLRRGSRNPKKIVPRALYISVIGLGRFYTLTAGAVRRLLDLHAAQARRRTLGTYYLAGEAIAGHWVGSLMSFLIIPARSPAGWRS